MLLIKYSYTTSTVIATWKIETQAIEDIKTAHLMIWNADSLLTNQAIEDVKTTHLMIWNADSLLKTWLIGTKMKVLGNK